MRYWLMSLDGDVRGPFDIDQLKGQATSGHLDPKTAKLCVEGSSEWVLAAFVFEGRTAQSSSVDTATEVIPVVEPEESAWPEFFRRCAATVIDVLAISAARNIAGYEGVLSVLRTNDRWESQDDKAFALFASVVVTIVASWVYFATMESSSWQATLGKRALGIRVTDLHGRRVTFECASMRYFASILSTVVAGLGFLLMLFNSRRQCLHDMIAGTLVLRDRSQAPDMTDVVVPADR